MGGSYKYLVILKLRAGLTAAGYGPYQIKDLGL